MKAFAVFFSLMLGVCASAGAQEKPPVEERLKALEEKIRALEAEVQALRAAQAAPAQAEAPVVAAATPAVVSTASGAQLPAYGGSTAASNNLLNPAVSVIGNFQGTLGHNRERPVSTLRMHETEIAFQAVVDPFARADFFVSLSAEGVELEEGFLTFTSLPGGFVAKAGKMRAAFGKVNALHNDGLPWVDRPLVTENLLAGDEGINDAGFSVSRIFAGPRNLFLEATAQVFRGETEELFEPSRAREVSVVGHFRGYKDLTESTNVDLGFSYARGYNGAGADLVTNLYGVDATFRWKPLRRAIYNSFTGRAEFVWSRREDLGFTERAFGYYVAGDYRINRRWTVGGRFDRSGRATAANETDQGFSAILTYWPSEFSQIRGQYRFARYAGQPQDASELRFQFLFNLGAHGAHPF